MKIRNTEITRDSDEVYFIAEIGCNHKGYRELALEMIEVAKDSGVNAVKFQMFNPLMVHSDPKVVKLLDTLTFTDNTWQDIRNKCKELDLDFICTPFDFESVDRLMTLGPDCIKIGSGENRWTEFVDKIADLDVPTIISGGNCDYNYAHIFDSHFEELSAKTKKYKDHNLGILHCVSEYPPKYDNLSLSRITSFLDDFPNYISIGYSDHTDDISSSLYAITLGARIIEKHFDLVNNDGLDHNISINYNQFRRLITQSKTVLDMLRERPIVTNPAFTRKLYNGVMLRPGE
jgi:sialic acid synthase SpsE